MDRYIVSLIMKIMCYGVGVGVGSAGDVGVSCCGCDSAASAWRVLGSDSAERRRSAAVESSAICSVEAVASRRTLRESARIIALTAPKWRLSPGVSRISSHLAIALARRAGEMLQRPRSAARSRTRSLGAGPRVSPSTSSPCPPSDCGCNLSIGSATW